MTNGSLMKAESIAECPWSILQYFWPALNDNWSWKPIFDLFESGRFTQVLLYYQPLVGGKKNIDTVVYFGVHPKSFSHKNQLGLIKILRILIFVL